MIGRMWDMGWGGATRSDRRGVVCNLRAQREALVSWEDTRRREEEGADIVGRRGG